MTRRSTLCVTLAGLCAINWTWTDAEGNVQTVKGQAVYTKAQAAVVINAEKEKMPEAQATIVPEDCGET
jgi:uncharacterized protein affecting Mg2+/Co2+ transport